MRQGSSAKVAFTIKNGSRGGGGTDGSFTNTRRRLGETPEEGSQEKEGKIPRRVVREKTKGRRP